MLYDNEATEDTDAETTEEDVTINGERKIPGRQKVVRGSNVQVFNFARRSESPFETRFTQPYGFVGQHQKLLCYIYSGNEGVSLSYQCLTKKRILAFCGMDFFYPQKYLALKKSGILEMKEARYGEQERKRAVYDTEKNRCNDS